MTDQKSALRALKLTARIDELETEYNAALLANDKQRISEVREAIVALHREFAPGVRPPGRKG
jgi:hypothetical protein